MRLRSTVTRLSRTAQIYQSCFSFVSLSVAEGRSFSYLSEMRNASRFDLFILPLGLLCVIIRWLYLQKTGIILGSDSTYYLHTGEGLARTGILNALNPNLLYQFYPLLLTPITFFNFDKTTYIQWLHIFLSSLTVVFAYLTANEVFGRAYARLIGLSFIAYPTFLFWLPYVLSEITLLFSLSIFIFFFVRHIKKQSWQRGIVTMLAFLLLIISRPTSISLLPLVFGFFLFQAFKYARLSNTKALIATVVLELLVGAGIPIYVFSNEQRIAKVYRHVTVSGMLNLAARTTSSNFAEYFRAMDDIKKTASTFPQPIDEDSLRELHSRHSLGLILNNKNIYLKSVVTRWLSFWLPGAFSGSWSWSHVIIDTLVGLWLLLFSVLSYFLAPKETKTRVLVVILVGFSFSALCALLYMDTDGRYRLPSELIMGLLAWYPLFRLFQTKTVRVLLQPMMLDFYGWFHTLKRIKNEGVK